MVADDRPAFLTRERFPEASGFVAVDDPADAAKEAGVDDRTFVVVMSHHFLRDKEYVRSMLGSPAAYIGTLGPGARTERLLMELRDEGVEAGDAARQPIHRPPASTSAAKARRRSRRPSSRRSSRSSGTARAASSVTAPDRSTTGPGRERLAPVDASSGQTVPLNVSQSFGSPPR